MSGHGSTCSGKDDSNQWELYGAIALLSEAMVGFGWPVHKYVKRCSARVLDLAILTFSCTSHLEHACLDHDENLVPPRYGHQCAYATHNQREPSFNSRLTDTSSSSSMISRTLKHLKVRNARNRTPAFQLLNDLINYCLAHVTRHQVI